MEHLSDDELLALTPSRPAAFAPFYRRHERAILAYMRQRTGDAELAADLTAETFAAALVSAARYRPGSDPAIAWLFGIARNKWLHATRRGAVEDRARHGRTKTAGPDTSAARRAPRKPRRGPDAADVLAVELVLVALAGARLGAEAAL